MDSNDLALGIDLGGSKIYAVVTDAANSVLATAKTQTESNSTPEKIAQATGRTPNVHFSGAEAIDAQELEKKMMGKTPVKVFKAKKELPALQVPGLAL